jgi:hypothetical protein
VAGDWHTKPTLLQLADERPPEIAAAHWLQSVPTLPARGPTALDEEGVADTEFMTPNVELTGPRRHGALAARQMMSLGCLAARVPCRSGSG